MEGNVGVAKDGVWVGIVEGAPFEGEFLLRPRLAQDLLGGGHVGLAAVVMYRARTDTIQLISGIVPVSGPGRHLRFIHMLTKGAQGKDDPRGRAQRQSVRFSSEEPFPSPRLR
jgi:hypothetical protein